MRAALLLSLFLVPMLAGCVVDSAAVRVEWSIRNDGPEAIEFRGTIAGDDTAEVTGRVLPGQTLHPDTTITGVDFVAEIALLDDARASAGTPFAADPLCGHQIDAVWDGEGWTIDVYTTDCA